MNAFPVFGYIYKTMSNRKNPIERIAFIRLVTLDGIKAGSKIEIIEFFKKNPVKDMETFTTRIIFGRNYKNCENYLYINSIF